ncbi:MAG: hypothetical protein COB66_09500 [Coxiella sp. (in: Bacteria)]|nr:MAG: hypothetical protein COB66_09500 [Coxiella sp. (in: g-proteobacteria)]
MIKPYIGAEEEYFLVDRQSKQILRDPPQALFDACMRALPELNRELFCGQIELASKKCASITKLHDELCRSRQLLQETLKQFKAVFVAASTYPTLISANQVCTPSPRYLHILNQFHGAIQNYACNALHVHVNLPSKRQRISVLKKLNCFLPMFLALSSSSPFYDNALMGLQSYRIQLLQAFPVSGFVEPFNTLQEYKKTVRLYGKIGFTDDESNLYWHARLGFKLPTIETRIMDVCPRIEDSIALAALTQSLIYTLTKRSPNALPFYTDKISYLRYYLWQARRYPIPSMTFIDFNKNDSLSFVDAVDQLLEFVAKAAKKIGCLDQLHHIKSIASNGTSADRQAACFKQTNDINAVCQQLIDESNQLP